MGLGVLTLTELKDELTYSLGNRSDTATRLTRFLNLAQQRIARVRDFEELRQVTDGVFSITSAATVDKKLSFVNLREIYSFRVLNNSESIKLKQVSVRQWDSVIPSPEYFSRGVPSHYAIWKRIAELWKVPDQPYNYQVRWTAWPTPFTDAAPTATSDYLMKDELIGALAAAYAFDSLSKNDDADRKYQIAGQLLNESLVMDNLEPDIEYAPSSTIFNNNAGTRDYWLDPFNMRGI